MTFTLRPQARWHDGQPITVDDVIWTFETLRDEGIAVYRAYYASVAKVEKVGDRAVKFTFKPGENRELPLILGQLPVLPKHYWEKRDFEDTTLDPPLGSGAYKIDQFEPGRWSTYKRVADYWGKDLPVNRGRDNFDALRFDYYRDMTVALEAFKAGEYDLRLEASSKDWATAYDVPAVRDGALKKEEIPNDRPAGMQGFAFNLRRPLFQDRRVRQALGYAFDFEWSNRTLFYGQYTRSRSYFANSELAANGVPSGDELEVLEPFRGKVPDEVFTTEYQPPATDGSGNIRDNLRKASELLKAAGWTVDPKSKKLVNAQGQPFEFEILLVEPAFERITLPFAKNLERLGITARVRTVDTAQYQKRTDDFDFDVVDAGVAAVAVARQRAARLLGLCVRRPAGQPERARAQGSGGRRAGRADHRRARPRQPGGAHARARPRAAVGLLRRAQLVHRLRPLRLLGQVRPTTDAVAGGADRHLVDRSGEGSRAGAAS